MKRIAIVGSNLTGLVIGWLLSSRYKVTLVEDKDIWPYQPMEIDSTSRVSCDFPLHTFVRKESPLLTKLCYGLKIPFRSMTPTRQIARREKDTYLGDRGICFGDTALRMPMLNFSEGGMGTRLMMELSFVRFQMARDLRGSKIDHLNLSDYLYDKLISRKFCYGLLLPMLAVRSGYSYRVLEETPVRPLLDSFLCHTGWEPLETFVGGIERLALTLTSSFEKTLFGKTAQLSEISDDKVMLRVGDEFHEFDEIICTYGADRAARFLSDRFKTEKDQLSKIEYSKQTSILHDDTSVFKTHNSSADWLVIASRAKRGAMSNFRYRSLATSFRQEIPFIETRNPLIPLRDSRILVKKELSSYQLSFSSIRVAKKLKSIQEKVANRRVWLAAGYLSEELPGLESCLKTALWFAKTRGVKIPNFFE